MRNHGSLACGSVDCFENRVDFLVFEVVDGPLTCALEGNAQNTLRQFQVLRIPRRHKMKERMNGRKPHVPCGRAIVALLFQVRQERKDAGWIQIRQIEPRNGLVPLSARNRSSKTMLSR